MCPSVILINTTKMKSTVANNTVAARGRSCTHTNGGWLWLDGAWNETCTALRGHMGAFCMYSSTCAPITKFCCPRFSHLAAFAHRACWVGWRVSLGFNSITPGAASNARTRALIASAQAGLRTQPPAYRLLFLKFKRLCMRQAGLLP